ncbi:MAG: ABC transporter substrate-binding protein, partial [Dehalococcoidales bacterium]|nr:ABC transporter substrate-binding protein [Dehalococcoidales bacterium]
MLVRSWVSLASTVVLAALLLTACSPAPSPLPPSPQLPTVPAAGAPSVPVASGEDTAWANVVASAKKEGKVTFYSVTYVGEDGQTVADTFYQRYGIKVDIIGGRGSSNFERLRTEKRMGTMVGDIVQASTAHLLNMKQAGILKKVTELPTIKNRDLWEVDPFANDPDGYVASFQAQWITPLINTRLVPKDKEPKSLRDLLRPEWKGKIVYMNPVVSTGAYWYYAPFVNRGLIDWSYVEAMGKQDLA